MKLIWVRKLTSALLITILAIGVLFLIYSLLPKRQIEFGAWTEELYDANTQKLNPEKLQEFEKLIDRKVSIAHFYRGWEALSDPGLLDEFEVLGSNGWKPMLNVNPYYFSKCPASDLPLYKAIAQGNCDAFLRESGKNLSQVKKPFYLLFAWEMNNKDVPWSIEYTRSNPEDFVTAWRHIHDIFEKENANNIIWVFCPNTKDNTSISYNKVYPGDRYVDWLGLDGYNWGTTQPWSYWSSFSGVFTSSYRQLVSLAPNKPIIIAEVNTTDQGGDKAAWYQDMFEKEIPYDFPHIKAVVIYNEDRTAQENVNWRVDVTQESLKGFISGVKLKFYK